MTDYDSPWKEALDLYFQPFMHFCFAALAEHIDWSVDPKMLDKELMQIAPQSELGARTVDKLVEVKSSSFSILPRISRPWRIRLIPLHLLSWRP